MPRILLSQPNEKYRKLFILLNGSVAREKYDMEEVGRAIGTTGRSVYTYLKKLEEMRLDKLLKLGRHLNIPIEELRECIRY